MKKALSLILTALFIFYGSWVFAYEKDKVYQITLLHTNDHHGRFWKNRRGEYGMAARKTLIDKIRREVGAEGGYVLLLSGGDINTGVPESDLQDAEPDFKAMRLMDYDGMAVGNHEFDNPLSVIRKQEVWAGFPFLSANIFKKGTDQPLFRPYVIYSYDGLKIGLLGFTTEDTRIIGNPEFLSDIAFRSPIDVAKKLVPDLKKQADVLIAVTHIGHYRGGSFGGNSPGDVTLARSVKGIDVIVGGHSQNPIFQPDIQNGTIILQAAEWGKYVGRMNLEFVNGTLTLKSYRLIPINLKKKVTGTDGKSERVFMEAEIEEDPSMLTLLESFQNQGQEELEVVVGNSNGVFVGERSVVRNEETNLGNLIALAQMEKTNADLSVMNSGGIRADLPAGNITYKDILIVQPFANTLCTVVLNGEELKEYLQVVANRKKGSGAFPQFTHVELSLQGEQLAEVKVAGKPLVPQQSYKLALNSFIASGGDGYPKLKDHPSFINTGYVDADLLKEYIVKNSPLKIEDYAPTGDVMRN